MTRLNAATRAAVFCLVGARLAGAQVSSAQGVVSELSVTVGLTQSARRDLSASPLDFGGHGGDLSLGYARQRGRTFASLSLDGGTRVLVSSSSASQSTERLTELRLHAAALRRMNGQQPSDNGLALGAGIDATIALTAHAYGGDSPRVADFALGTATIGPAASWQQRVHEGELAVQLLVPIVGVVDHSYSPYNAQSPSTSWRIVTPGALRGLNGTLTYASSERVGMLYVYRVAAMRYDDVQPVRVLTQSLSVGALVRLGALGR